MFVLLQQLNIAYRIPSHSGEHLSQLTVYQGQSLVSCLLPESEPDLQLQGGRGEHPQHDRFEATLGAARVRTGRLGVLVELAKHTDSCELRSAVDRAAPLRFGVLQGGVCGHQGSPGQGARRRASAGEVCTRLFALDAH
jgi:hypothetical protein